MGLLGRTIVYYNIITVSPLPPVSSCGKNLAVGGGLVFALSDLGDLKRAKKEGREERRNPLHVNLSITTFLLTYEFSMGRNGSELVFGSVLVVVACRGRRELKRKKYLLYYYDKYVP